MVGIPKALKQVEICIKEFELTELDSTFQSIILLVPLAAAGCFVHIILGKRDSTNCRKLSRATSMIRFSQSFVPYIPVP